MRDLGRGEGWRSPKQGARNHPPGRPMGAPLPVSSITAPDPRGVRASRHRKALLSLNGTSLEGAGVAKATVLHSQAFPDTRPTRKACLSPTTHALPVAQRVQPGPQVSSQNPVYPARTPLVRPGPQSAAPAVAAAVWTQEQKERSQEVPGARARASRLPLCPVLSPRPGALPPPSNTDTHAQMKQSRGCSASSSFCLVRK